MKQYRYYILTMILMALLFSTAFFFKLEPLHSFSLRFNDTNFAFQNKKASNDVIFLAIDEASVNAFGRWPWNRDIIAKAINNLDEESLLIFDMVFSETTPNDSALAHAIETQGNNVCGFFLRHKATEGLTPLQYDAISDSSLERLSTEVNSEMEFIKGNEAEANTDAIMQGCTLSATFSTLRDSDQLLRKYPIAFTYKGELVPSIGVQTLRLLENQDITYKKSYTFQLGTHQFSTDTRGFGRLNYYPLESYVTHSFLDLYENKLSPEYLKGKVIILGLSEIGLGDIRVTPLGQIPGPLVHYTFISNILNNELLHEYTLLSVFSVFFFLLLPLIWILVKTLSKRMALYFGFYGLFFIVTKLLFVYDNLYLDAFYPLIGLLFSATVSESLLYKLQERQIGFIKDAFSTYLSPQLLQQLLRNPARLKLGGEKRELTIFFSDIRGFTSTSEKMDPEKLTTYLNRYFTPMSDIITQHNGMIDKYIGDAIMALYNAPVYVKEHAKDACSASLEMLTVLEKLNREFIAEDLPPIAIGIGLNSDEVVVGNMGSNDRFNYTAIGDGVNLASRIEGLNKELKTQILITEKTRSYLDETFLTRPLEAIKVKGKEDKIFLYELLPNTSENQTKVKNFKEALKFYNQSNNIEALKMFRSLQGNDPVCDYFIEKLTS